jgi:hypothetical protein
VIPSTSKMAQSALLAWIHAPLARTPTAAPPVFLETTSDPTKMYAQTRVLMGRISMASTANPAATDARSALRLPSVQPALTVSSPRTICALPAPMAAVFAPILTLASRACPLTSSDLLRLSASTPACPEPTNHGPTASFASITATLVRVLEPVILAQPAFTTTRALFQSVSNAQKDAPNAPLSMSAKSALPTMSSK